MLRRPRYVERSRKFAQQRVDGGDRQHAGEHLDEQQGEHADARPAKRIRLKANAAAEPISNAAAELTMATIRLFFIHVQYGY